VTSFFEIGSGSELSGFCVFPENKTDLRQSFFQGLRENSLFITTCIEKHCTGRPLIYGWRLKNPKFRNRKSKLLHQQFCK